MKEESEEQSEEVCYFCGKKISREDRDDGCCSWCGMHFKRENERTK
jgi:predicted amidophosphoribosyltransferase